MWLQFLYKISFAFGVIYSILMICVVPILAFIEEVICFILSLISYLYNFVRAKMFNDTQFLANYT